VTAGTLAVLLAALLLVGLVVGPLLTGIAHRLDRLHLRCEAAWAGLDAALGRRAAIARSVVATGADQALADAADRAERAPRDEREAAENELTRQLGDVDRAGLPVGLDAELADAEQRVVLARRVHNDAVRDTVALRRWRSVRWLRLAGTAPRPAYFEMLEPATSAVSAPVKRPAARVLLADARGRVLLFRGIDPHHPEEPYWFTPGGALEPGEEPQLAAVRELAEETGLRIGVDELTGPVWLRRAIFEFEGTAYHAEEWFYLVHTERTEVDTSGFTQVEIDTVDRHSWWSAADLVSTSDKVYPEQLAELLPGLLAEGWDGRPRSVS
jgi:8-oxo-dGTP pyrophosphatase MutT (NUDIX family)